MRSNKGLVRKNNQDNVYANGMRMKLEHCNRPFSLDAVADVPVILAVCDGMGGEKFGEEASSLAVDILSERESHIINAPLPDQKKEVQSYVNYVNEALRSRFDRSGTTLALIVITEQGVCCYNIGDTRIYCVKNSSIRQISFDHTYAAEICCAPRVKHRSEIKNGNKLTRCIGIGENCTVENCGIIHGRTRLLICSDGLTDLVEEQEIAAVLAGCNSISAAADGLIHAALGNGGRDNVSVIIADIQDTPIVERIRKKLAKGNIL